MHPNFFQRSVSHHWKLNSVFDNHISVFVKNVLHNLKPHGILTKPFYDIFLFIFDILFMKQQTRQNQERNYSLIQRIGEIFIDAIMK